MTDKIDAIVVVLERDIRIDDAALIISAISQIRGVVGVKAMAEMIKDARTSGQARAGDVTEHVVVMTLGTQK